jgi:hypothetical protein
LQIGVTALGYHASHEGVDPRPQYFNKAEDRR